MKAFALFVFLVSLLPHLAAAAQSFAGSNLYYAAGLTTDEQKTLFTNLKEAGVKVLRVWLDGQDSPVKGTKINSFKGLETDSAGQWNGDEVLNRLDDLMVNAQSYGIKLLISLHSYNSLESKSDFYGKKYGTKDFYTSTEAQGYFKTRINHVLAHVNPHNKKPWSQCSEYIFAFEAENEMSNGDADFLKAHGPTWQCMMAGTIKSALKNSDDILVTTGGGGYVDVSLLDGYFSCNSLDVLAIHAYGPGDYETSKLSSAVSKAQKAGKKLLMQEWGACYFGGVANNVCTGTNLSPIGDSTRESNIKTWADEISKAGIPLMYWQVIPNADPHSQYDYEVGVTEAVWGTLKSVLAGTSKYQSGFDYTKWLP